MVGEASENGRDAERRDGNFGDQSARIEAVLREKMPSARDVAVVAYELLPGGYNNVMARFDAQVDGTTMELVARSDTALGEGLIDSDKASEWRLLAALSDDVNGLMPAARWFDDGTTMGTPTIILDRIDGDGLAGHLATDDVDRHDELIDELCQLASAIHSIDAPAVGEVLGEPDSWDTHIDASIEHWRRAESAHIESEPFIRYLAAWLSENRPPPAPMTLVHGDFQPANVMLERGGGLVAVDWEFAHIGDPREDLGWLQMMESMSPVRTYGCDPAGFCRRYCELSGLSSDVVNPHTVEYFALLAAGRAFESLLRNISELAEGRNRSLIVAYSSTAYTLSHELWYQAMRSAAPAPAVGGS